MSGFQLYRFKSIDKPLTKKEQEEINSWSSRARVNSTSATFIYHYGDFRKDEKRALEQYFDALLNVDNYGTLRLMFRFPLGSINAKAIQTFEGEAETGYTTHLQLNLKKNCWILDFYWADDEGGGWMEEEDFELEDFLEIRRQIMKGDYRALYLFWLKLASYSTQYEFDEDDLDEDFEDEDYDSTPPPVPANLGKLNGTLQNFVNFYSIDKDLITAAASYSTAKKTPSINYEKLIDQLPDKEVTDFLVRLAKGEQNLGVLLNRRLKDFMGKSVEEEGNRPSILELVGGSKEKETERLTKEAEFAQIVHRKKMEKLARRKAQLWKEVDYNIRLKSSTGYDRATETLKDLKDLAIFEKEELIFGRKMQELKAEFGRSKALLGRFERAGLF